MVLFCLKKLRCYYHHHDTIKHNILKGSKIILYVINHSLPREGLCQKVTNVSIKIVKTNKHTRKPTVDLFEMSFLGNMDHNYSIGVDC